MTAFPIPEGDLGVGSRGELIWMISTLFWLFFFNQFVIYHMVPVPMTGLLYRVMGCRVGKNTYFSGIVLDPHFASFGERVTVTILAGSKIGAGSIVGAMSLAPKGTIIGENELWAGVPAKFIRKLSNYGE